MNVKKWAIKMASLAEHHYQCHGINVKLELYTILGNNQRFIFRIIPMPGTKVDGIFDRAADIQAAMQIPLFQPFKKGMRIFLAVSMVPVGKVSLKKILTSPAFLNSDKALPVALGCDLTGEMVIEDLAKMFHAMYVGASGSGKSIGLICLILSLICTHPASEVNLIIYDSGSDTLDVLEGIPQLSHHIVKDINDGAYVIQSLKDEMERRYDLKSPQRCDLPAIICVMDEFNSYIDNIDNKQQRQRVVSNISKLLRRGRKVKIHFVLATQEPKSQKMAVEIGNITSRMAFKVDRYQTSITILNHSGAEKLPGDGAFLYQSAKFPKSIYVQGAYISDSEIAQLVDCIKATEQDLSHKFVIPEPAAVDPPALLDILSDTFQSESEVEREFVDIILWTLGNKEISAEKIKQKFRMGNRANKIIDKLFEAGLISEKFSNQPRKVLPQSVKDIPDNVMDFLTRRGISIEDVTAALSKRTNSNPAIGEQALCEGGSTA